jgi:outer membrane receptor protein involved in Fe transport
VSGAIGSANVALGWFGRNGSNLIVLDPVSFIPFNASRVSVNGFQLVVTTQPYHHVRANASVTDLYRALDTSTGARLPATPPIVATLGLERPFDGGALAGGVRLRVVGPTPNDGPQPFLYDQYTYTEAYVRYRFAPTAILTLRARNLGDARYMPIYGYPAPGRTFEIELATR